MYVELFYTMSYPSVVCTIFFNLCICTYVCVYMHTSGLVKVEISHTYVLCCKLLHVHTCVVCTYCLWGNNVIIFAFLMLRMCVCVYIFVMFCKIG